MAILSYRALALWLLGRPVAALDDAEHAIQNAREIGHAGALLYALFWASLPYFYCGNYLTANALINELVALADEKGVSYWKMAAMVVHGFLFAETKQSGVIVSFGA